MYRKNLIRRARHILWGPVEVIAAVVGLLVILSRPVMDYLLKLWEGLPWWVGVLLLGALVSYAVLRAGYELWKEEQQTRQAAEQGNSRLQGELGKTRRERDELRSENEELITETQVLQKKLTDQPDYSGSYFKDETIFLPDMARRRVVVKDRTFDDCDIYGPAVAAVMIGTDFIDCTFAEAGDRETLVWPPDMQRRGYLGVVGLENCIFRRCSFITVGLLADVNWPDEKDEATEA